MVKAAAGGHGRLAPYSPFSAVHGLHRGLDHLVSPREGNTSGQPKGKETWTGQLTPEHKSTEHRSRAFTV